MQELYLTKMTLNLRSKDARRDIGNPQELHKTVSCAFPKIEGQESLSKHDRQTPRNTFNILHRLELNREAGKAILFVQSNHEPDWGVLPNDYCLELKVKNIHEQYSAIENGMNLTFRLQANPSKRIANRDQQAQERFKDSKIRRRVELRTDEERLTWLKRKGEECGFQPTTIKLKPTVLNVAEVKQGKINFRKERSSPKLTFGSVVFEGGLTVTDCEKFKMALENGIGTGKAYGFGLLSIAKAR